MRQIEHRALEKLKSSLQQRSIDRIDTLAASPERAAGWQAAAHRRAPGGHAWRLVDERASQAC